MCACVHVCMCVHAFQGCCTVFVCACVHACACVCMHVHVCACGACASVCSHACMKVRTRSNNVLCIRYGKYLQQVITHTSLHPSRHGTIGPTCFSHFNLLQMVLQQCEKIMNSLRERHKFRAQRERPEHPAG